MVTPFINEILTQIDVLQFRHSQSWDIFNGFDIVHGQVKVCQIREVDVEDVGDDVQVMILPYIEIDLQMRNSYIFHSLVARQPCPMDFCFHWVKCNSFSERVFSRWGFSRPAYYLYMIMLL